MYQKMIIAGNLGRDPEMRYMPDGTAVTSFNVAVNDGWGENKRTLWFRVSIWGKRAETANQYLSKGSKVLVEGRLQGDPNTGGPKLWTRQDGTVGSSFEITASNFTFLSSRGDEGGYSGDSGGDDFGSSAVEEDDIPF
jgi:single-strand DNA-binding protein